MTDPAIGRIEGGLVLTAEDFDRLVAGGVDRSHHPALADAVEAARYAVCELELRFGAGPGFGRGWVGDTWTALLLPEGGSSEQHRLTVVPTGFLPEALGRLLRLRPLPERERAQPEKEGGAAVDRWRVEARWRTGSRVVGATETPSGWQLAPEGEVVSSTQVFRRLTALLPSNDELP